MDMSSTCSTCDKKTQDYPVFCYMCDDYFCSENCHLQKHAKPWQKYWCFIWNFLLFFFGYWIS